MCDLRGYPYSEYNPINDEEFFKKQKEMHHKYLSVIDLFEPDEDDIIMFKDDKKWQRVIFKPDEESKTQSNYNANAPIYKDYENEKYLEFVEHLDNESVEYPDWLTKRMLLRVLSSEEYDLK